MQDIFLVIYRFLYIKVPVSELESKMHAIKYNTRVEGSFWGHHLISCINIVLPNIKVYETYVNIVYANERSS